MSLIAITADAIDEATVEASVASPECGALLSFRGLTRNHHDGKGVIELAYEAYEPLAVAEMRAIAAECTERWPGCRVAMVHRVGVVAIGEASVVIAVAAPHRAAAYEASRYAIDELKQRVSVWKQERYADGAAWISNPPR